MTEAKIENVAQFLYSRAPILDPEKVEELSRTGKSIDAALVGRYTQIEKSLWQKWVKGSAWWASALSFLIVLIITAAELTLFDLVLEEKYGTLFPINDFYLSWLGVVLGFALAFYASTERSLWADYITQVQGLGDDCLTLAWQITSFVNPKKLNDIVSDAFVYETVDKVNTGMQRHLFRIMREINLLIRVYPMAVEIDNSTLPGDRVPPIDEADWPSNLDVYNMGALNLDGPLFAELVSYMYPKSIDFRDLLPKSPISDQILHMIQLRLMLLLRTQNGAGTVERTDSAREFFGPNLFASIDRQIGAISGRSSALHANRIVSTNPIIKGLLISSTALYVLLVPLISWGSYRWWTLAIAPVFQWVLLAFLFAGLTLEFQYTSYNKSNYVHVDTKKMAMDAAYAVDRAFDAYYRIGGIEHVNTKFTLETSFGNYQPV